MSVNTKYQFKSDPNSSGPFNILNATSGTTTGEWHAIDDFDEISLQAFSLSGTGAGTFSGTVDIQLTLEANEFSTPETVVTFSAAGMKFLDGKRASYLRGKSVWAGHNLVLLMKGYRNV
jgi:hypothetical protein